MTSCIDDRENAEVKSNVFHYTAKDSGIIHSILYDDIGIIPYFSAYLHSHPLSCLTPETAGVMCVTEVDGHQIHLPEHYIFIAAYTKKWVRTLALDRRAREDYLPAEMVKSPYLSHLLKNDDASLLKQFLMEHAPRPTLPTDVSSVLCKKGTIKCIVALLLTAEALQMTSLVNKLVASVAVVLRGCGPAEFVEVDKILK